MHPFQDPTVPADRRTADLLARLTLEEKVGQLCLFAFKRDQLPFYEQSHTGALLNIHGEALAEVQAHLTAAHRLRVPVLFGLDCVHGHGLYRSAAVFPIPLGLSMTWNPELLHEVGRVTAREMDATGIRWTFAPNLDVVRDLRWGRVEETFGEDPWLVGTLTSALIRGLQNDGHLADGVLACGKHLWGYSETRGGRDSTETTLSFRHLIQSHELPYRLAIRDAGLRTVMAGYHGVDGTPCSLDRDLLTGVLRERLGFDGFVVSDFNNLRLAFDAMGIGDSIESLCPVSLAAGNDMPMNTLEFPAAILDAVRNGRLAETVVDTACGRILRAKFELGLFEPRPTITTASLAERVGTPAHLDLAEEAAAQSIVLLENRADLLPLSAAPRRLALIGPHVDNIGDQLGNWTNGWGEMVTTAAMQARADAAERTILTGLRERLGPATEITSLRGCGANDDFEEIDRAVAVARESDLVVLTLGDTQGLTGEGRDRATLELRGRQLDLFRALKATGKPVIVVLVLTKPLAIPELAAEADTLLALWNSGTRGGLALAAVLCGDRAPTGRLTVSFPHSAGQAPSHYLLEPGWHGKGHYVDLPPASARPVYPFGYGLAYTTFEIRSVALDTTRIAPGAPVRGTVTVANTGSRPGVAVAQFYVQDVRASVTRPAWWLATFVRAEIPAGESVTMPFAFAAERLAIVNKQGDWQVEPGEFRLAAAQRFDPDAFSPITLTVEG